MICLGSYTPFCIVTFHFLSQFPIFEMGKYLSQMVVVRIELIHVNHWYCACHKISPNSCKPYISLFFSFFPTRRKIVGWPKSLFSFSRKIKDTVFIFTNYFIDLDILTMLTFSCYWLLVGRGQGCCWTPCIRQPHSKELFGQYVYSTKKLCKPLLTRSISHSTFSIQCTNFFISVVFLPFLNKA